MNSDDELGAIREVLAGETASFRPLVERYEASVFRFIRSFVADAHESEDLAQEVFLTAFAKLPAYLPTRASFSTWLFTIARNRCLNHLKRQRCVAQGFDGESVCERTPVNLATEAEFFRQLDQALAALPFEQRTAFVLYELEGLTYEQIAVIEDTRLGTVRSRISRARDKLRGLLAEIGSEI